MEHSDSARDHLESNQLERERAYQDLQVALDEERKLSEDINSLLKSSPDRLLAEHSVLHEFAAKMEQVQARSRDALSRWLSEIERL
jgi:hypothetical protein